MTIKILNAAVSIFPHTPNTYIKRIEGEGHIHDDRKYDHPMLIVDYRAKANEDVSVGAIYLDRLGIMYIALKDNYIENIDKIVRTFEMPTELTYIGSCDNAIISILRGGKEDGEHNTPPGH